MVDEKRRERRPNEQSRVGIARQTPEVGITRRKVRKREYIRRADGTWVDKRGDKPVASD
jgi:hypothetical protein